MRTFFAGVLGAVGGLAAMAISFGIIALYLTAFFEGAELWFGWEGYWVAILAVLLLMFLGPIGTIAVAVVGGYGAYYGWDWHWLICVIVFFPGLAFMVGGLAMAAVGEVFAKVRS